MKIRHITAVFAVIFLTVSCTMPPQGKAVFDDRETFIKPQDLPINIPDEGVEIQLTAEDLEAVIVTPDGQLSTLEVSPEELAIFLDAVEAAGAEGAEFGSVGDERDDGELGATAAGEALMLETYGESGEFDDSGLLMPESVIGVDQRTRVTGTTRYPFRTIGRIDIGCTGTLIGPRHVLTAGHCVYNIRTDRWYSKLRFSPGQNGSDRPYGRIGWARAISVRGWTRGHKRNFDYAMIVLSQNIGNRVGWMGYGYNDSLPKYNVNINGYPGDKPAGTMWHSFCKLKKVKKYRLYYPCDTAGGMSGSGVYVYWPSMNRRIIYGIHAYGVDGTGLNGATRIRKPVFENLKRWKARY